MTNNRSEFEQLADKTGKQTLLGDVWYFLAYSRKWWLLPLICALLMLGGLMMLSGSAIAPFIYTLF